MSILSSVQVTNTLPWYIILILYSVRRFTTHALELELSNLGACTKEQIETIIQFHLFTENGRMFAIVHHFFFKCNILKQNQPTLRV